MASLWPVPDQPAAVVMSEFYRRYVRSHESPTQALAEAMRVGQQTYEDPSLWGAYDLSVIMSCHNETGGPESGS
jgi:CHAT domain-containing protein